MRMSYLEDDSYIDWNPSEKDQSNKMYFIRYECLKRKFETTKTNYLN
jgi:hypothetical protein